MLRQHSWPEGHWNWPIKVSHQHGVKSGEMIWVGGQVNLDAQGVVLNPGNLSAQLPQVIDNIARTLAELEADLGDLVNLNCFYVNQGAVDEEQFIEQLSALLPPETCTAITLVPTSYLCYDQMLVEIEAVAMLGTDSQKLDRRYFNHPGNTSRSGKFCDAIRCGKMIFVSAQGPERNGRKLSDSHNIVAQTEAVKDNLYDALSYFGANFDDTVKINRWYTGGDDLEDFEPAALSFAANFTEPGPAATGIPIPRHSDENVLIKIALIAMLGENDEHLPKQHAWPPSLWDWHVHLPYQHGVKCAGMIFLGGQVSLDKKGCATNPGNLTAQTHQAMEHIGTILNDLGASYQDVCKVLTLYQGNCGAEALHENLPIRSSYFNTPGPATTGVPLPVLAYENMCIEIDIYAMVDDEE